MTSELIQWHDLDGYARGVVDGHDKYLIQPVAFEGFHGYELIRPTSDGDLQLGYYKRVSTAKQIAEDKERARSEREPRSRPERFERATAHEAGDTPDELMLYDQIRPHDRVTIVDRFGQQRTGRVVMRGPAGWVLNMGGQHGTPAIATPENVVRVRSAREVDETAAPWPTRRRTPGAREDAGPQGALDWKQRRDDWYAKTFGGAEYILSPEGEDGFHAYYVDGGKREDLGGHTTLGAAMAAARAHQPAMSRAAEAGGGHLHSQKQPPEMPPEVRGHWQTTYKHQLPTKWSLERLRWNHTLYRVDAWVGRNLPEGSPRPDIFAVDARSPKEAERIVLDGWLREKYIGDWTFEAEVTEWPIDDGVPRMIPASSFSFSSEAGERVPVLHEDDPEVAVASVTKTETVTVAVANEDFSTVAQAEQHAYTEGFRYIAKHGKRYHVYKRRAVGKKGYERREMYHRRGKWHISGDRKMVTRLGEGARTIKVSQTAGTIRREEQAPVAAPEAAPVEVMAQEAGRRVVHVPAPEKALTKDQQEKADRAYKEGLSAGDVLGNQMTTDEEGQSDIRRLHRKHELRDWTKRTAENEAEREDRGQYWQIGFLEGLRRTIDAWAKHNLQRYGSMASESPSGKLTLAQAKAELRPLGLILTHHDGEYRVNFRRGNEESAYYTPDLDDAVATGKDMAKRAVHEASEDHMTAAKRRSLPSSAFAIPEQRKLPINDRKHVKAAASRLSMMLHDGSVTQAEHDHALKRIQRAGRRLGVNVSAASEAYEPAKEEPAGVGCAPCDAAVEEKRSSGKSTKTKKSIASKPMEGNCAVIVDKGDHSVIERTDECRPTGIPIDTAEDVWNLMREQCEKRGSEWFFVIGVTTQGELLGSPVEVAKGQPDRVSVDIEQIVAAAIHLAAGGARGVVIGHQHPSGGHATPSRADRQLTDDVRKSMEIACPSTPLLDHVIVSPTRDGHGEYFSFEEEVEDKRNGRKNPGLTVV